MSAVLNEFSDALQTNMLAAKDRVVAIRNERGHHVTGTLWQDDIVIASEQAMGARESYSIICNDQNVSARIVGRDAGTNLLALRTDAPMRAQQNVMAKPTVGSVVLNLGATREGTTTVRLGIVNALGAQWHSRAGGRIDARISLDIRLGRTEEGGPVIDTRGALLGISTFGPRDEVLVIPSATVERVLPQLLSAGHVQRGWLGLALQPIAIPDPLRETAGGAIGMMVMSIADESPGAQADVQAGDIVLAIDGTPMHHMRRVASHLDQESIGKSVELRLLRHGQLMSIPLEIRSRPHS
ncbi:MAG: S1C family serine protease [Povalibacter sp.]